MLLACLGLCALAGAEAASAASQRAATRPCQVARSLYPGEGYVTTLTVKGTSCATGKKLAVEYYKCRVRNGGRKGTCTKKVMGYSCTEGKRQSIQTEFNARVTCKNGSKTIVHTYEQILS